METSIVFNYDQLSKRRRLGPNICSRCNNNIIYSSVGSACPCGQYLYDWVDLKMIGEPVTKDRIIPDETLEEIKALLDDMLEKVIAGEFHIPSSYRARMQKIIDRLS